MSRQERVLREFNHKFNLKIDAQLRAYLTNLTPRNPQLPLNPDDNYLMLWWTRLRAAIALHEPVVICRELRGIAEFLSEYHNVQTVLFPFNQGIDDEQRYVLDNSGQFDLEYTCLLLLLISDFIRCCVGYNSYPIFQLEFRPWIFYGYQLANALGAMRHYHGFFHKLNRDQVPVEPVITQKLIGLAHYALFSWQQADWQLATHNMVVTSNLAQLMQQIATEHHMALKWRNKSIDLAWLVLATKTRMDYGISEIHYLLAPWLGVMSRRLLNQAPQGRLAEAQHCNAVLAYAQISKRFSHWWTQPYDWAAHLQENQTRLNKLLEYVSGGVVIEDHKINYLASCHTALAMARFVEYAAL